MTRKRSGQSDTTGASLWGVPLVTMYLYIPNSQEEFMLALRNHSRFKALLPLVLALLACLAACTPSPAPDAADESLAHGSAVSASMHQGFASPEAAMEFYLHGLRDGNEGHMIDAYAITQYAENFDLEADLNRFPTYFPISANPFPPSTPFALSLNTEQRRSHVISSITFQLLCLVDGDLTSSSTDLSEESGSSVEAFLADFDEKFAAIPFSTIEIQGFLDVGEVMPGGITDSYRERMGQRSAALGVADLVDMVVLFRMGGDPYLFCATAGKYDDHWLLVDPNNAIPILLDIYPVEGGLFPVPEDMAASWTIAPPN